MTYALGRSGGWLLSLCSRHFRAAAIFSVLLNLLYIGPTIYMLQVYDRVLPTRGVQTLALLTLALLFALITLALLDRARMRLLARAGVALDAAVAPALLDAVLAHPDAPSARQELRDFDQIRATLIGPGVLALFDAPWLPIYVAICFLVHPWIGLIALSGGALLPAIAWANERATRGRVEQAQEIAARTYAAQDQLIGSAETIRALGMARALGSRQIRERRAMIRAQTEAGLAAGNYLSITKFARLALQSLALGAGALLAIDSKISPGAIFASSFLIARALAPIEQLVATWRGLAQARSNYRRLRALLERNEPQERTTLPPPEGALVLENVTVLNDARDGALLHSISLSIAAGEIIAIVGPSGAGKSTLARAVAGAIPPDRGTIRVDGADARDWMPERLARHIGYLPQEPSLFAGTVAENVSRFSDDMLASEDALSDDVVDAVDRVGARSLVLRLSDGFDHRLRPGGRGISAGQAQRIALARAVYGNPALLVLDEPNAHLDAEGDAALVAALARMKAERRTVLIVSHKLSILPVVDRIMVLRAGKVDAFGPRDEIMARLSPPDTARRASRVTAGG